MNSDSVTKGAVRVDWKDWVNWEELEEWEEWEWIAARRNTEKMVSK